MQPFTKLDGLVAPLDRLFKNAGTVIDYQTVINFKYANRYYA